jgi:hypothetical protein
MVNNKYIAIVPVLLPFWKFWLALLGLPNFLTVTMCLLGRFNNSSDIHGGVFGILGMVIHGRIPKTISEIIVSFSA